MSERTVRYFTRASLIAANKVAIKTDRNRTLYPEKLEQLPIGMKYPVVWSFVHNDCEMRVMIALNETGWTCWLDIPFETYQNLDYVTVEA